MTTAVRRFLNARHELARSTDDPAYLDDVVAALIDYGSPDGEPVQLYEADLTFLAWNRPKLPCGTERGYLRHGSNHEPYCEPCRDAHAALYRARGRGTFKRPTRHCGTLKGYDHHQEIGEAPCGECRQASAAYLVGKAASDRQHAEQARAVVGRLRAFLAAQELIDHIVGTAPDDERPLVELAAAARKGPAPVLRLKHIRELIETVDLDRPEQGCGTLQGYRRHLADGEDACQRCLDANARHAQRYSKAQRKTPSMPKTRVTVAPYDSNGNLAHYARQEADRSRFEWRANTPFEATLTLDGTLRGRTAAYFEWRDSEGRRFPMFISDMAALLQTAGVEAGGVVKARWMVAKRGQNFGLRLATADEVAAQDTIAAEFARAS